MNPKRSFSARLPTSEGPVIPSRKLSRWSCLLKVFNVGHGRSRQVAGGPGLLGYVRVNKAASRWVGEVSSEVNDSCWIGAFLTLVLVHRGSL